MPESHHHSWETKRGDEPVLRRDELCESQTSPLPVLGLLCSTVARQVRASYHSALRISSLRISLPAWLAAVAFSPLRFQKYRIAPRLGTDTVRRRLLLSLHQHPAFPATETGLA